MVSHPATSSPDPWRTAPSLAEIELLAYEALTTIPDELRRHVGGVVIRVEDFPDDEIAADMELESPFDLLGLYTGVSLDRKSISDTADRPRHDLPLPPADPGLLVRIRRNFGPSRAPCLDP